MTGRPYCDNFVNCQYAFIDINLIITSKNSSLYRAVIPVESFREPAKVIGPTTCPFIARIDFWGDLLSRSIMAWNPTE